MANVRELDPNAEAFEAEDQLLIDHLRFPGVSPYDVISAAKFMMLGSLRPPQFKDVRKLTPAQRADLDNDRYTWSTAANVYGGMGKRKWLQHRGRALKWLTVGPTLLPAVRLNHSE